LPIDSRAIHVSIIIAGYILTCAILITCYAYYLYLGEELVARYVFEHAKAGDADSVVKAMDAYARKSEEHYMFVGDDKGPIVEEAIRKWKPKISFELGTYCGYSAVRFGKLTSDLTPGAKYYAFEYNPTYLEIAKEVS
jgi:catechol O-methyltransferase